MKENRIAAVVVTYNRKELLKECIEALKAQTYKEFDIWIIDNHSTDGTHDMLHPMAGAGEINYRDTGANLGGAGGFAYGLGLMCREGYKYAWIMDDDSIPSADALEKLIEAGKALRGRFGFLSSRVVWTDGSPCRMNVQRNTLTHNLKSFDKELEPVVIASFVSMFVPIHVVRKYGLPIAEFFIWTDDWEFSRRISRKEACYAVRDSVVTHKTTANSGADISREVPERLSRFEYAYRNEIYLYRREGLRGIIHVLLRTPLHIFRVLTRSKDKKLKRIKIILGSTLKGFSFNPEIKYPQ